MEIKQFVGCLLSFKLETSRFEIIINNLFVLV